MTRNIKWHANRSLLLLLLTLLVAIKDAGAKRNWVGSVKLDYCQLLLSAVLDSDTAVDPVALNILLEFFMCLSRKKMKVI